MEVPRPFRTQRHLCSPPAKHTAQVSGCPKSQSRSIHRSTQVTGGISPCRLSSRENRVLPCAVPCWHVLALLLRSPSGTKPKAAPKAPRLPSLATYRRKPRARGYNNMDGTFTTMPRQARVFESSLHSTTRNTRHTAFDNLIRDTLIQIAQDYNSMGADSPSTPPAGPLLSQESATILRELGDYFTRTAQMWSTMTHQLLNGPHIDQVAYDIHNRSAKVTNLTDISTISAVDVEIGRLRYAHLPYLSHTHSVRASNSVTQANTGPNSTVLSRCPGHLAP